MGVPKGGKEKITVGDWRKRPGEALVKAWRKERKPVLSWGRRQGEWGGKKYVEGVRRAEEFWGGRAARQRGEKGG